MSNFLLQNAGISAFFEDDDDFFGEDTAMCSEVDDDDLPLTNYLLKFDVGEEEPWDSTEDLSVGGESVDERDIFGLGCEMVHDEEVAFTFESGHWNEDAPDRAELVEKEVCQAKNKDNHGKEESVKSSVIVDLNDQKQTTTLDPKNVVEAACVVHSKVKATNVSITEDTFEPETNVSLERSKNGPLKTTIKTQAEKAKEQRQRKKKFVQELQDTIEELKQEKAGLQQVNTQLNDKIGSLQEEISYLKGVIANQSELAKILRTVANIPGISINCSVLKNDQGEMGKNNKRKCVPAGKKGVNLSDENTKKRRMDIEVNGELENNAGVCVHVQSGKVSLEFCPECSKKAKSTPLS
ncbi:unnamed protein product [Porites lobata]|uniref:BZIP domain-containing protein n=1 Tax=Porites lobata TaxID=104759 RepID=A0ABN8PTT0_9CNID|nr:unnamed protein product [Porites lobata]